jgi:cobalamin synthase
MSTGCGAVMVLLLLLLLAVVGMLSVVAAALPCLAAAASLKERCCGLAVHTSDKERVREPNDGGKAVHALFLLATAVLVHAGALSMAGFIVASACAYADDLIPYKCLV